MQAPERSEELAAACIGWSERSVLGVTGPLEHVRQVSTGLRLDVANARFQSDDRLYALDLAELVVPEALSSGTLIGRAPREDERAVLHAWRVAYEVEILGAVDSPGTRERTAADVDRQIAAGDVWIALGGGVPTSISMFNAALPDIVQLGGIYTPPEFRGRGYARVAIAASLLAARERGVTRAVLFTANSSAMRTYEALGFRHVGAYALMLLQ